jgi:hypothetical protein
MNMTERIFQDHILQLCSMYGWLAHHVPPMRYNNRNALGNNWGTGGLAGMPDLTLISQRGQGIIYAELKTETGKLSAQQTQILSTLHRNGAEVYVWRPSDLTKIASRLSGLKPLEG